MMLQTHALHAGYKHTSLLGPLDLELPVGRLICLIGANGAGKSTLIRTLCGMQRAVSGTVTIDGTPLERMTDLQRARNLAVVLTDRVTAPAMTGYELASLGRYPHVGWSGRLSSDDHAIVHAALKQAGALPLATRQIAELSDGERQKILIARALAQEPRVLVLDEATAFLDLPRRIETMQLLLDLARSRQLAILLSTHDLELALRYADALWLIDPARRLFAGAPEDLALNGALSNTFSADGLIFDLERGELSIGRPARFGIRLEGDGMHAAWARRALLRAGYAIDEDAPAVLHAGHNGYTLRLPGHAARTISTLGKVVDALAQPMDQAA